MQVLFGQTDTAEFVDLLPTGRPTVRTLGPGGAEALKALRAPAMVDGKVNGITVPAGARWVFLSFNDKADLEGEFLDIDSIREFQRYTVTEAGWFDVNHYSRPARIPPEFLQAGRTTTDFKIGKITEFRFGDDGTVYVSGFLWPAGVNPEADKVWKQLNACPESFHCSPGGIPLGRTEETGPDGKRRVRLKIMMNHLAICDQAVNPNGTRVSTARFGEFAKALADGVPFMPECDGETCVDCFVRGPEFTEAAKAISVGGAGGLGAGGQNIMPQSFGTSRVPAGHSEAPGRGCKHCDPKTGKWPSLAAAKKCLVECTGKTSDEATSLLKAATERNKRLSAGRTKP